METLFDIIFHNFTNDHIFLRCDIEKQIFLVKVEQGVNQLHPLNQNTLMLPLEFKRLIHMTICILLRWGKTMRLSFPNLRLILLTITWSLTLRIILKDSNLWDQEKEKQPKESAHITSLRYGKENHSSWSAYIKMWGVLSSLLPNWLSKGSFLRIYLS